MNTLQNLLDNGTDAVRTWNRLRSIEVSKNSEKIKRHIPERRIQ